MKNLNLCAPVGTTGYGVTGFNILRLLDERGWDISLFSYGDGRERRGSAVEMNLINKCRKRSEFFYYDAPCLNIWHQHELSKKIGNGKYIGFPIFELETFNERERHHMNYPDNLCVCSEWAKQVVDDNDILCHMEVHVVPLGIDNRIFTPDLKADKGTTATVFLNCGKWEIRKGHDFLIDVFNEAFTIDDDVELWMLPHNPFLDFVDQGNWENLYMDTPMGRAGGRHEPPCDTRYRCRPPPASPTLNRRIGCLGSSCDDAHAR